MTKEEDIQSLRDQLAAKDEEIKKLRNVLNSICSQQSMYGVGIYIEKAKSLLTSEKTK